MSVDPKIPLTQNTFPCKEWSLTDDVLNISDSACVTVSNEDGEHTGKFQCGQLITIDVSDPAVVGGKWFRHFTGRITALSSYSDIQGGTNIQISAMDLGWHLTSSQVDPIQHGHWVQIKNKTFRQLLDALIDPSWKVGPSSATEFFNVRDSNVLNKKLKHGRQIIIIEHKPQLGAVLPFIQIEPGQTPFEIIQTYAQREGVIVNVGAQGDLIFFRPFYDEPSIFTAEYHGSTEARRKFNNVEGRPTLNQTIDGMYSETQCWSTVVIQPSITNTENPNEAYRHTSFKNPTNPFTFKRLQIFSDGEAISETLRRNRAIWKQRLGLFNSWTYEVEFTGIQQNGGFFCSDSMITVNDSVHQIKGAYYVTSVQKTVSLGGGERTRLTIKQPGLLSPNLTALPEHVGAGAKKPAQTQTGKK